MNFIYIIFFLILIIIILVYIKNKYLTDQYENFDTQEEITPEIPILESTPEAQVSETTLEEPLQETTLEEPLQETTLEAPLQETTLEAPLQETTQEEPVLDNSMITIERIKLSPSNDIIRTCIRDEKKCYYELDKIIKANKKPDITNSFKVENNKGYSLIISSDEDPILIEKGMQIDIKVINDEVQFKFTLLK